MLNVAESFSTIVILPFIFIIIAPLWRASPSTFFSPIETILNYENVQLVKHWIFLNSVFNIVIFFLRFLFYIIFVLLPPDLVFSVAAVYFCNDGPSLLCFQRYAAPSEPDWCLPITDVSVSARMLTTSISSKTNHGFKQNTMQTRCLKWSRIIIFSVMVTVSVQCSHVRQ